MLKDMLAKAVIRKEELRREHNRRGALVRSGKMSDVEFRTWVDLDFDPKMDETVERQFALEAAIIEGALGPE